MTLPSELDRHVVGWLRSHGYPDARVTGSGIRCESLVVVVKNWETPVRVDVVDRARAYAGSTDAAIFSSAGYTANAVERANSASVALFRVDRLGAIGAANPPAAAMTRAPTSATRATVPSRPKSSKQGTAAASRSLDHWYTGQGHLSEEAAATHRAVYALVDGGGLEAHDVTSKDRVREAAAHRRTCQHGFCDQPARVLFLALRWVTPPAGRIRRALWRAKVVLNDGGLDYYNDRWCCASHAPEEVRELEASGWRLWHLADYGTARNWRTARTSRPEDQFRGGVHVDRPGAWLPTPLASQVRGLLAWRPEDGPRTLD